MDLSWNIPLNELRSLVDFGLLVLIWMVQLIVYPSFRHTAPDDLSYWHGQYSTMISIIVIPLMLGQVALIGTQLVQNPAWPIWIAAFLVLGIWISTFSQAVPLHHAIQSSEFTSQGGIDAIVSRLISANWTRTILWSIVFGLGWIRIPEA